MSTVIAMAYTQYSPVMHLSSSARHLEEIRRVTSRLSELITESERARLDLQMLFGVHVFSRAEVVPDLAISRGEDAHGQQLQGDRSIEFLAAGGVAMTLLELGDVDGAERWIAWPRMRPRWPRLDCARASSRRRAERRGQPRVTRRACAGTSRAPSPWRRRKGGRRRGARPWPAWRSRRHGSWSLARPMTRGSTETTHRPGAGRARRTLGRAGQGAAAAPAGARTVGCAGRRRPGHRGPRARRPRGRRHGRRRGLRGAQVALHEDASLET